MDRPISRGTSGTLLPLNLCPRPQNGENEGSLPVCPACPEKALSPQVRGHCHGSLLTPLVPLLGCAPGLSGRQQC